MSENKRLNNYDELPLVLDVVDIQLILVSGISYGYPVIWKIQEVQTDLLWKSL